MLCAWEMPPEALCIEAAERAISLSAQAQTLRLKRVETVPGRNTMKPYRRELIEVVLTIFLLVLLWTPSLEAPIWNIDEAGAV